VAKSYESTRLDRARHALEVIIFQYIAFAYYFGSSFLGIPVNENATWFILLPIFFIIFLAHGHLIKKHNLFNFSINYWGAHISGSVAAIIMWSAIIAPGAIIMSLAT
jgi:hypothetical protein